MQTLYTFYFFQVFVLHYLFFYLPLQAKDEEEVHIAIAGNIGSGKTTLTNMLSRHYGWKKLLEAVEQNPYIEEYYQDIPRWSFNMEVYFLKQRFRDLLKIQDTDQTVVQDRTIFEGVYVFAANNKAMGFLNDTDFNTYMALFQCMMSVVKLPDLMIYLRSSVPHLVRNIEKRDRSYERTITLDYLTNLNLLYEDFIFHHYKGRTMVVEVDAIDFEHLPRDFGKITDRIDAELYGLFSSAQKPVPPVL